MDVWVTLLNQECRIKHEIDSLQDQATPVIHLTDPGRNPLDEYLNVDKTNASGIYGIYSCNPGRCPGLCYVALSGAFLMTAGFELCHCHRGPRSAIS